MSRHTRLAAFTVLFLLVIAMPALAERIWPGKRWSNQKPDAINYSTSYIRKASQFFDDISATGAMVIVGGKAIADWGTDDLRVNVHQIRGCLLSALIGIHVERGEINLSSTLGSLGIDDVSPPLTNAEKQATVQQLLQSRSGIYHGAPGDDETLPTAGSHPPGSFWAQTNWEQNVLAAILEKKTGESVFETFKKDIADPIDMSDYQVAANKRVKTSESQFPSCEFYLSARDMARFGYLYLSRGHWHGDQIIPAQWVTDSVAPYSMPGVELGFGYQWYTSTRTHFSIDLNSLAFSARGSGGQYIAVVPSYDLVMVLTSDTSRKNAPAISNRQFGTMLSLVLQAKNGYNEDKEPEQ